MVWIPNAVLQILSNITAPILNYCIIARLRIKQKRNGAIVILVEKRKFIHYNIFLGKNMAKASVAGAVRK